MSTKPPLQIEDLMREGGPITPRPIYDHDRAADRTNELGRPVLKALREIRKANPALRLAVAEGNDGVAAWNDDYQCWVAVIEHMGGDVWNNWLWVDGFVLTVDGKPLERTWIEKRPKRESKGER